MFGNEKYRLLLRFYTRPVLPFAVEFVILAPLILTPGQGPALYLFLAPWLILFFAFVSLPLASGALRAFRMDVNKKRNHALEHATIRYLEQATGRQFGGRAESDGFRIRGRAKPHEIHAAFGRVSRSVRERQPLPYVSRRCGSNAVTALELGLSLLLAVALVSMIFAPPVPFRVAALIAVVLVFAALRHRLGNAIQRRFFMAVDFAEVSARQVRSVPPDAGERGPVHVVETRIRVDGRPQSRGLVSQSERHTAQEVPESEAPGPDVVFD